METIKKQAGVVWKRISDLSTISWLLGGSAVTAIILWIWSYLAGLALPAQIVIALAAAGTVVWTVIGCIRLRQWYFDREHELLFVLDEGHPYHVQNTEAVHMYRIGVRARNQRLSLSGLRAKTFLFDAVHPTIQTRTAMAKFQNAPLMIGDDREIPPRTVCDLNPGEPGSFEFVTQVRDKPWGDTKFHFCHAMGIEPVDGGKHGERKKIYEGKMVRVPTDDVPLVDCKVTVFASAKDVPARYQDFLITIRDGLIYVAMDGPPRSLPFPTSSTEPRPLISPASAPRQITATVKPTKPVLDPKTDAIACGGLIGAKALIQRLIEGTPTNPWDFRRGGWQMWLTEMDSLLAALVKEHKRKECMTFLRSIEVTDLDLIFAGSSRYAVNYLRGFINNLSEADLNVSPTQQDHDATTAVPPPARARDQESVPSPPVAS